MKWSSMGTRNSSERPVVGDLIAFDRGAHRVMHLGEADPTEAEEMRLIRLKPEYRERNLPFTITLRRIHGPADVDAENDVQECGLRVPAMSYYLWQHYDEDRVPLCSCCGHPWPCLVTDAVKASAAESKQMEAKMAKATPGCCYSCGEVITHRQGSVTYPEANIELPGFPTPRFHTRNACWEGRYAYEQKRARALPDAPPLLVIPDTGQLWGER